MPPRPPLPDNISKDDRNFLSQINQTSGLDLRMPEPPPTNPEPASGHTQGVSWDKSAGPPVMTHQPVLSSDSAAAFASAASNLPPRPAGLAMKTSQQKVGKSTARLDMGDVIGPMELEAETHILKSLEEQGPPRSRNNTAEEGRILSNVPNEMAHDFTLSPLSPSPSITREVVSPPRSPQSSHNKEIPNPKSSLNKREPKAASASHRRTMTVEESLFGLTSALSAIQGNDRSYTLDDDTPANQGTASADRLARTVNILFNRNIKKPSTPPVDATPPPSDSVSSPAPAAPAPNAKSRWAQVKANMGELPAIDSKKNDDVAPADPSIRSNPSVKGGSVKGSVAMADIEQGDSEIHNNKDGNADEIGNNGSGHGLSQSEGRRKEANPFKHLPFGNKIKDEWDTVQKFLKPRQSAVYLYLKITIIYLVLPLVGIAAILFHVADNPPTGKGPDFETTIPSAAWWLLFIVRQVCTFSLAKMMETFIVDFLSLQTQFTLRVFGPVVTLLVVQSKGWPFMMTMWGIWDFALLAGDHSFARHWLYWQDVWGLFNEKNPAGDVASSLAYFRILAVAVSVGCVVSVKRLAVGLYLGRQTFSNFSTQLGQVMNKMLLVSEVAVLAKDIELKSWNQEEKKARGIGLSQQGQSTLRLSANNLSTLLKTADDEDDEVGTAGGDRNTTNSVFGTFEKIVEDDDGSPLNASQKTRIAQLLGNWEEPARGSSNVDNVPVSAVLQFRRALAHMDTDFPFSPAFGVADTRETCIASAQDVFLRLLLKTPESDGVLPFETIARTTVQKDGELNYDKVKDLIRIFRPDRDGSLNLLDFARSVDAVYKELRLLRATIAASSKIDVALENLFNVLFYGIVCFVILSMLGFDPLALFLSLSSIILAFAFMISSASAKYFEGILFILVQRPFSIGDRINVSSPESDANSGGAQGWIVENVTLFTTSVVLGKLLRAHEHSCCISVNL
jgi:hypothetical protein